MISIIIMILLAWAFYVGYSRGLYLQLFYSLGIILAGAFALSNYQTLAAKISMWVPFANAGVTSQLKIFKQDIIFQLDKTYYAGIAFLLILVAGYLAARLVGIFFGFLSNSQPLGKIGSLISGILALLTTYFILETGLTILAMVPINSIQDKLSSSGLVKFMITDTPILSKFLLTSFFENIIHLNPIK
ncbi:CvpA family protein [Streptococcaceae bacterium ESL0687]|nr:CvpA family protein [Streptococcaceae bacterium ESL0687]